MYSQRMIGLTLDGFEQENGWRPEPRTPEECDELVHYIDSLIDTESNSVNRYFNWKWGCKPSKAGIEWIFRQVQNEQMMCFSDAQYFATRYGRIRTVDERIVRIQFRQGQKIFHSLLEKYDDEQRAIQIFCLKARQVGISTIVAMYFIQRILFRSNTHAVMASAQTQQSDKLAMMIETTCGKLPFWLPPSKTSSKDKEPRWSNGSALSVQAGSQNVGIAEGSTPTCLHLSEIGSYATPKKTIEMGVFPAAHQTSALFFVMEGTGSTVSAWQKEKWDYYKEQWGKGGRFQTMFIPPACADDIYPPPDWLRTQPIPSNWQPLDETHRMKRRCELFVRSTDYLYEHMGADWEMARSYMWYWECGYREAVASHTEKTFISQNAVTDSDAFQSKYDTVFSDDTVHALTKDRQKDYMAYAITGKTIVIGSDNTPYCPPEEEIDYSLPRIPLKWDSNDGHTYEWELVPLKEFDDSEDTSCFDKFLVFHAPVAGAEYAEGIDTADGLGMPNEDRCVCTVSRIRYGRERDEQAGSFTSLRVNSAQMSRIAAAIAVYFTTDGNGHITSSNPLAMRFIIEQIRKTGDECQLQLKIMGFYDHHVMHFYDDKGNIDANKGHKEGWRTSRWSRTLLLSRFVNAVTSGWFKPNDPILIRQLKTFVRKEKNGASEMGHESGQHDDNIFGAAMAWTTAHDFSNDASRLQDKYTPLPTTAEKPNDGWCSNEISID